MENQAVIRYNSAMNFKEIKGRFQDLVLGRKGHGLVSSGRKFVEHTVQHGAIERGAINLFTRDRKVLEVFELESQKSALAGTLAGRFPEGTEDDVIDRFIDDNDEMKELMQQTTEAKRKLSMAQLGALLKLQGQKIEDDLDRFGL